MSDDIRRHTDQVVRKQLARVHSILAAGRHEEALRMVNRIDLEYPNRKEVLELRVRCIRASGRRQFQEWSEDDDKASIDFEPSQVKWLDVPVNEAESLPRRRLHPPTLIAYDPTDYHDLKPETEVPVPTQGLLSFAIWTFVITVYGLILAQELIPRMRGGEVRNFAGMQFVWIPAAAESSEGGPPPRGARGDPGFWIGRFEVTQEEWYAMMEMNPSAHRGDRLPVDSVSPDDVLEFLDRMNRMGAGRFRLPTDAEWKRASVGDARIVKISEEHMDKLNRIAWYSPNSEDITHEIGEKKPAGWGLYDQFGNVAEWCVARDRYAEFSDSTAVETEWSQSWVIKGGSAVDDVDSLSPLVAYASNGYDRTMVGLRLVREAGKDPSGAVRVVHFPKKYSLGTVRTPRRPIGEAKGDVRVRKDEGLILEFSEEARDHWKDLAKLRADDLTELLAPHLELTDVDVEVVSKLEGLETLNLATNPITDGAMKYIAALTNLKRLRLGDTEITGAQLHRLAGIERLEHLSLSRCQQLTGAAVDAILSLEHLKMLDIDQCGFSREQILELQMGLPACTIRPAPDMPTLEMSLTAASVGGKYAMLAEQFADPDAFENLGFFVDAGYLDSINYRKWDRPAGYWVYVKPYWYIWNSLARDFNPRLLGLVRQTAPWSPKNAVGAPDHQEYASAQATWSPGGVKDDASWLALEFERPVDPLTLRIYVTNPILNVSKVTAFSLAGKETVVWRSVPALNQDGDAWVAELPISFGVDDARLTTKTARMRLYINADTEWVPGTPPRDGPGTCIDSVELLDSNGDTLWARAAMANSTFADFDALNAGAGNPKAGPRFVDPATIEYRGVYGLLLDLARGGNIGATREP